MFLKLSILALPPLPTLHISHITIWKGRRPASSFGLPDGFIGFILLWTADDNVCRGDCRNLQSPELQFESSSFWCRDCNERYICKIKDCKEFQPCNETSREIDCKELQYCQKNDCKEKHSSNETYWLKLGKRKTGQFIVPWNSEDMVCHDVCRRLINSPFLEFPRYDMAIASEYWCRNCDEKYICKLKN